MAHVMAGRLPSHPAVLCVHAKKLFAGAIAVGRALLALLSSKRRFETLLDKKIEGVAITAPIIEGNGCEPHKISTC